MQKIVISTYINNCLKQDLGIGPFPIVFNGLDIDIYHHVDVYRDEGIINFLMLNHTLSKKGVKMVLKYLKILKKNILMQNLECLVIVKKQFAGICRVLSKSFTTKTC